ncbi:MAG: hypothetical protein GYB41_03635 [Oceanospirillales bacterium]|nr:hypothetical protein [Oceanospirillales bacterium]
MAGQNGSAYNRRRQQWWPVVGLFVMLGAGMPGYAELPDAVPEASVTPADAAGRVNLLQASELAQQMVGGEIIKAELTRYRDSDVYLVRLLDQGRVRDVLVDTATGRMLLPLQAEIAE